MTNSLFSGQQSGASAGALLTTDQRGFPPPTDGDGDAVCDVGAFVCAAPATATPTVTPTATATSTPTAAGIATAAPTAPGSGQPFHLYLPAVQR